MYLRFGIIICFSALINLIIFSQEASPEDSLMNQIARETSDTAKLNHQAKLVNLYLKNKEIKKAELLLNEAISSAKEKGIDIPYRLNWSRADFYFAQKEISKGLSEMDIVMNKLEKTGKKKEIAKARNFIGLLYLYGGEFSKSINTYNENIDYAKKNKLKSILPKAYSGLSYVYRNLEDVEERRRCLVLMADAAIKENDYQSSASAYLSLGDIGMESDSNFTYAIEQYKRSLDFYKKLEDSIGISFLLLRIGWNHYLNNELDLALNFFFHSLEYSIPINRLTSITNAYGNIGTIYRDRKEYDKAIKYYRKSIEYSFEAKDWYNLSWLYLDMSTMYKNQGDYKSAFENHVLHKKYSDSLEMQKFNQGLTEARTRYEAEKAEKELELVSLKLKQQKYYIYGFGGLVFLVIVIGVLFIRQSRLNARQRISEMNHKISEVTQKNLRQQMNPHFIFNTLNSIQYYMYQHDKISTNNYLTKFSLLMRKTLENSQHTAIPIKDELDALKLYLELESLRFKEKFKYSIKVDDDIDTLIMKIPTMLIQPYVENAICHGLVNRNDKGYVEIDLKQNKDHLVCKIEDNGIGRKAAMEIKKQKNGNHNSLGTKITESRLKLVNSLYGKNMKIDYTDLEDTDGNGAGTRVIIHIPIMT